MGEITALLVLLWFGFGDKMLNPKNSRLKRMIFFLIFYVPLAVVLVRGAYTAYNRIGWLFSCILYAIVIFLFFFLGEKAWFASKERERAAFKKVRMRILFFWVKYKKRLFNKKIKLTVRIFLFTLMFLPLYAISVPLIFLTGNMSVLFLIYTVLAFILTVVSAILVFCGKKE